MWPSHTQDKTFMTQLQYFLHTNLTEAWENKSNFLLKPSAYVRAVNHDLHLLGRGRWTEDLTDTHTNKLINTFTSEANLVSNHSSVLHKHISCESLTGVFVCVYYLLKGPGTDQMDRQTTFTVTQSSGKCKR